MREAICSLQRAPSPFIKESSIIYVKDIFDHAIADVGSVDAFWGYTLQHTGCVLVVCKRKTQ